MSTVKNDNYNGWKNRQTWNVSLWINNEESLYRSAVAYVKERVKAGKKFTYAGFISYMGMQNDRTPDNIAYISTRISHRELNAMMKELINH